MVFNPDVFSLLDGDGCVLERAPMEALAEQGELVAFEHEGCFYAMDTYREFLELNRLWNTGDPPWRV